MQEDNLKDALQAWQLEPPSPALDARVVASYRGAIAKPPFWRRLLMARVSIPVPVAALIVLVIAAAFLWRERPLPGRPTAPAVPARSLIAGSSDGTTYITVGDLSGFRPATNGTVTIETKGGPQ